MEYVRYEIVPLGQATIKASVWTRLCYIFSAIKPGRVLKRSDFWPLGDSKVIDEEMTIKVVEAIDGGLTFTPANADFTSKWFIGRCGTGLNPDIYQLKCALISTFSFVLDSEWSYI